MLYFMQSLQQKKMENMRNIRRSYIRKLGVTHFLRLVHSPFRRSAAMQFFPIFCVLLCVLLVTGVNAFALPKSFRVFAGRNGDVTASRTARSPVTFGSTIQKISKMRAGASKSVTEIANQVQFAQLLKDTGKNKLIVADFTASWCPPCKMIAPIYQSMSEKFPNVVFTKIDVDSASDVAKEYAIQSMPTFLFFKNGGIVARFSGASVEKLRAVIETYK